MQSVPTVSDGYWEALDPLLEFPIRVVPIAHGARRPLWNAWDFGTVRKSGRYGSSATTDRARLRKVTETGLRPEIGVPHGQRLPSGGYSLVLDVDAENGGLDSWVDLCTTLGDPPSTATVLTKTEGCFHKWVDSVLPWSDAPGTLGPYGQGSSVLLGGDRNAVGRAAHHFHFARLDTVGDRNGGVPAVA